MLERTPDYFEQFHCLAGRCPKSCCTGWEVVIDGETAAFYGTVPGPLGEELRASLRTEDGERCFALSHGRCPFLDGRGLCRIYTELGEEHLSGTCRLHPRFAEEYGPLREISLAASCPAAAELLLGSRETLTFPARRTPEPEEAGDPWLAPLLALRGRMLELLGDRARPLASRLSAVALLAEEAQPLLDQDRAEGLASLPEEPVSRPAPDAPALFPGGFRFLRTLELLEEDWPPLLTAAESAGAPACPDWALERICAYFLFRYVLKTVNDGDLLGRVRLCMFSTLTVRRLSACVPLGEALYRYCREIEHSEENLEALTQALRGEESQIPLAREIETV